MVCEHLDKWLHDGAVTGTITVPITGTITTTGTGFAEVAAIPLSGGPDR
jgi:hypothetical protein